MFRRLHTILKVCSFVVLVILCANLTTCKTARSDDSDSEDVGIFDFRDDNDIAVELVHEANRNLKSIRVLYNKNNPKMEELKKALNDKDTAKVKQITDDLSLVIIDGYVLAENAKEKIDKAKDLSGISSEFREYLELKSESLELQVKAFNYRRDTAKLFGEVFGSEDPEKMEQAKIKFTENETKFAEYIGEAKERIDDADKIWSESKKKK